MSIEEKDDDEEEVNNRMKQKKIGVFSYLLMTKLLECEQ